MLALLWKHLKWPGLRILYLNTEMLVSFWLLEVISRGVPIGQFLGTEIRKMACFQLCVVLLHVLSRTKQGLTRLCSFKKTLSSKVWENPEIVLFPQLQYYWPWWQEKLLASWRTLVMMWLLAGAWPFSKEFLVAVQYHRYVSEWTSRDSAYNWTEVCL